MSKSLGIYVSSDRHLDKLIELCRAAKRNDIEVRLFFTHLGTRLCADSKMAVLQDLADVAVCNVGFEANDLQRTDSVLSEKAYGSQTVHAEMIYDCDRYISF